LIHKNLDSWRAICQDTDQLFHLVLAALDSDDPRVRVAAVEIDLVANNLRNRRKASRDFSIKSSRSEGRYLAL